MEFGCKSDWKISRNIASKCKIYGLSKINLTFQ